MSVLPFGNTGADSALDFVANGLADEVASALARSPGIQIKSRTGARAYKGAAIDVAEAGLRLKAKYLLLGDVRQQGGRWILSADLERASDATAIWDTAFNVSPDQQSGAAEVIAASVVAGLRKLFPRSIGPTPALRVHQRTDNAEAFRLYLRGQEGIDRRKLSVRESASLFRAAIHEDSLYARAHAGLSMALALFPYFEDVPVADVQSDLIVAAHRALELDPTLALPHVALGLLQWFTYQWDSAETEFQTALRLERHNVEAHIQYARFLNTRGRHEDALRQLRLARDDDPVSAVVHAIMANTYFYQGQLDSALAESRRSLQNDATNYPSLGIGASIHLANGLPKEARDLADRARRFPLSMYVIAKTGDTAAVRQWLRELDGKTPQAPGSETRRAFAYLGLGDTARALAALERATDARELWHASNSPSDPAFAAIRESARFRALLRRVGLAR
jgi:TolB-like protein/tetratricopeptide (TPR) repeat protein